MPCVGLQFPDAPLLGRTVCFLLNTTRLGNYKPDGLKVCEKHKHTGIWETSAPEFRGWEGARLLVTGVRLRSQPEMPRPPGNK